MHVFYNLLIHRHNNKKVNKLKKLMMNENELIKNI